jgi:predicted RNA-binding Zn-ribbon protein involved in translation (DUF1610 family)
MMKETGVTYGGDYVTATNWLHDSQLTNVGTIDVTATATSAAGTLELTEPARQGLDRLWSDIERDAAMRHIDPVPMILNCPSCGERHIDEQEFATKRHHTHACQHCGMVWRPAIVATVGVQFLPGFKNDEI